MTAKSLFARTVRLGCALALLVAVPWTQAQTLRSVRPAAQPAAPAAITPGTVTAGAPSPNGLASPIPDPAGLNSQFPAGLPDLTVPSPASSGATNATTPAEPDLVPPANVMGAGAYGGTAAAARRPAGAGPYTAVEIAQSFIGADANRDGQLTPAEAQRLTIMPSTFEDMDLNHDGVITRSEYEDSLR